MKGSCDHIGLFSQNPDILVAFYTEKLGFEQQATKTISKDWMKQIFGLPVSCRLIKLRWESAVVEIFVPRTGKLTSRVPSSQGYNHWGLSVGDKELFVRMLERKGVQVLRLESTGRFIYFIKDPEGNLIEIYE